METFNTNALNRRVSGMMHGRAGTQGFIDNCALLVQKRILRSRDGKELSRSPTSKKQDRVRLETHVRSLGHAEQRG